MIATLVAASLLVAQPQFLVRGDSYIGTFAVKHDGTFAGLTRAFGTATALRHVPTGCRATWPRMGLSADLYNLGAGGRCKYFHHAVLTGSRWKTANGLRIGDSSSKARRLFPRARKHRAWLWLISRTYAVGPYRYPGLAALIRAGRVAALRVEYPAGGD